MVENLSYGTDCRGDYAYFVESSMVSLSGWILKEKARTNTTDPVFFRLLKNGEETHRHGWVEDRKIVQWG